jgi:hypothetical protein
LFHRVTARATALAIGIALVFAVTAFAVTPQAGKYTSPGEGGTFFTVTKGGKSLKKGGTAASNFKCNKVNLVVPKGISISGGKFSFKGKVKTDAKGTKGTLTWKGRWTTATKVKGTTSLVRGSCKSGTVKWTAAPFTG